MQNPDYRKAIVIGAGASLASASGALVSFNANTGGVAAVLPFTGTRAAGTGKPVITEEGGQRVLRGHFLSAWDGTGKNLAPDGAKEIRLDPKTGAVITVR